MKAPEQARGDPRFENQVRASLHYSKNYVALERLAGCRHRNKASGRTNRYGSLDFGVRDDLEDSCRAVEHDPGSAHQIVSQNSHASADLAGYRQSLHERLQAHRQAESSTTPAALAGSAKH
jgi:hypothetical protein